jgi:5-(carboxyamino)imidazole ribonucleotide mutase
MLSMYDLEIAEKLDARRNTLKEIVLESSDQLD